MPEISILMPVYADTIEKGEWLNEAVKSLVQQTFTDWELILINDNSPQPLLTEFDADPRIRRFKTGEQSGPALCRNTAAALAEADALFPLDADDKLAEKESLEKLYEVWTRDKSKIIYGDLKMLQRSGDGLSWSEGNAVGLPPYEFGSKEKGLLNLNGVLPVSCIHSVQCHLQAGGWKGELEPGLEDLEYWISAGKAGFCGVRIEGATLVYRKHEQSRQYALRRKNQREGEMRRRIQDMHKDVFEGRFPMGCCGGGRQVAVPAQNQSVTVAGRLDQVAVDQKTWVRYKGQMRGEFGVKGSGTGTEYKHIKTNSIFEVHNADLLRFRGAGRGLDFEIGVAPPDNHVQPEPVSDQLPKYEPPEPVLAVIQKLDDIAEGGKEFTVVEDEIKAEAVIAEEGIRIISQGPGKIWPTEPNETWPTEEHFNLESLGLGETLQNILQSESWSIERLAKAEIEELLPYPGIGKKRAELTIKKAREFLSGQG